ncbi:MAG: GAF domain-containing protein [Pseudohongiellaceae bacterium]
MNKTPNPETPTKAQKELMARLRQQAALARLGQYALTGCELQELMNQAVNMVAHTLEIQLCKVLELQRDGKTLLLRSGVGWRKGLVGVARIGTELESQAGFTLRSDEPVIVRDLGSETRFNGPALLRDHGVISGLSVIINVHSRPFGVLGAHTTEYREFSDDDANFLQNVANMLAMVIERDANEDMIRELSMPVLQIFPRVLLVPVVGRYDANRAVQMETLLLEATKQRRARVVVLDVTAANFDAEASPRFVRTLKACKLLGAEVLITGVSPALAESLVTAGQQWQDLHTVGDLESGVQEALAYIRENISNTSDDDDSDDPDTGTRVDARIL